MKKKNNYLLPSFHLFCFFPSPPLSSSALSLSSVTAGNSAVVASVLRETSEVLLGRCRRRCRC